MTGGGKSVIVTAGATDRGLGVESIFISFNRSWQGQSSNDSYFSFYNSNDSFADGISSSSEFFNSTSAAGTYSINSVSVTDKAGNTAYYQASDLTRLGFQTSFMIVDRSAGVTAYVTAPESIREGDTTPIALTVTLPNVTTARTDVTLSFAADQSTARNGEDARIGDLAGSYSISQSPAGNYVISCRRDADR